MIVQKTKLTIKYLFLDFLQLSSTRAKLIWATFFVWASSIAWFMVVVPVVREFFSMCYARPCNLQTSNDGMIFSLISSAFAGTVVAYVASKWSQYSCPEQPKEAPVQSTENQEGGN